jgi:hypothetical protein
LLFALAMRRKSQALAQPVKSGLPADGQKEMLI